MSNASRQSVPIITKKIKLRNRRIYGGLMFDGTILWTFRSLQPDKCIMKNKIRLTQEAIVAMWVLFNSLVSENNGFNKKELKELQCDITKT